MTAKVPVAFGSENSPVEIAATTSRVFLGVQLQCAQCHNARTEPWKREQFHELVAFFGRARIIQHKDVGGRGTPYAIEGREDGQYFMTDKKDPSHLIGMTPRFLTGESVSADASDAERRAALARFITNPKNPWFARAYINRMWTCLMGWGFYPTVHDLGSGKPSLYPEVLDLLADAREELRGAGRSTEDANWQSVFDGGIVELVRNGRVDEARELLRTCLSSSSV